MAASDAPTPPSPHGPRAGYRYRTPEERVADGRAARKRAARTALGDYSPPADRTDPLSLLEEQAATRLEVLVPIRYGRMAASPFAFFRGAALPMASDLSRMPSTGLTVQLCGDAHLSNFGAFGTPERRLVFDINDFDETATGPFEWDVMRLCTSVVLACRERGDSAKVIEELVLATAAEYRTSMKQFAGMRALDIWYSMFDVDDFAAAVRASGKMRKPVLTEAYLDKIRKRDSVFAAGKTTTMDDGTPRFLYDPPLQVPIYRMNELGVSTSAHSVEGLVDRLYDQSSTYRRTLSAERRHLFDEYRIVDGALRVVGVGSVGTRCFILLLLGRDSHDPLVLQVKQAEASVLERFTGPSPFTNHGERVVAGQKLTQSASDLFLGWTDFQGLDGVDRDYYVRQFRDWKASFDFHTLRDETLKPYVQSCAWALAKAHARSGDQIAISSYCGSGDVFDKAMLSFALAYAEQSEQDHAALVSAIDSGRVTAISGV